MCVIYSYQIDQSIQTQQGGVHYYLLYNIDSKENEVSRIFFMTFLFREKKSHQNEIECLNVNKFFLCVKTKGENKFNEFFHSFGSFW